MCWHLPEHPLTHSDLGRPPTSMALTPTGPWGSPLPPHILMPPPPAGLPPPLPFLHQLCSGPRPLLFSLGLSLLLLVGICVIGSQSEGRSVGSEGRPYGALRWVGRRQGQWPLWGLLGWSPIGGIM